MFNVGDDAADDDTNDGMDQAVNVAVVEHTKKDAKKKHQKSDSVKKDSRGKKASTETKEKEFLLQQGNFFKT